MNPTTTFRPLLAADLSILIMGLYLAGAFLVGALVVAVANRWRHLTRARAGTASDQLAHFRSLYEQGALSEEEYTRLRTVLGGELRQALDVPAGRPETPPAAPLPPGEATNDAGPGDGGVRPA